MSETLEKCPYCGADPTEVKDIVPGKVWRMACGNKYGLDHSFSVLSWLGADECIERWNTRYNKSKVEA